LLKVLKMPGDIFVKVEQQIKGFKISVKFHCFVGSMVGICQFTQLLKIAPLIFRVLTQKFENIEKVLNCEIRFQDLEKVLN